MYTGSCLCGSVRFEIDGAISDIVYCHCSLCRKAQGSAYATNGNVEARGFRFVNGAQGMTGYEYNPGQTKYFCTRCGSPIMSINNAKPDFVRVRLGTIESDIKERPACHIFASSKANWDQITDGLPQYDSAEPNK